tara:strand:- start:362 stop:607 length:246 start_codon:yes stop_codon:yes gene_type:complete
MSVFQKFLDLTHVERELVVFDEAFREIHTQLRLLENRPDGLEGVKDLLNNKTFRNNSCQTSEFDLAQALLLVVNRIQIEEE